MVEPSLTYQGSPTAELELKVKTEGETSGKGRLLWICEICELVLQGPWE